MTRRTMGALVVATLVGAVAVLGGPPTPAGAATGDITVFGASTPGLFSPRGVVEGPDGNLWFANQSNDLGEVTPGGTITMHDLAPDVAAGDSLADVTVGGDGNIWFTVPSGWTDNVGAIGRYNPITDDVDMFDSAAIQPFKITTAADGNLWVQSSGSTANRVLLNGTASASAATGGTTGDIMLGPDGNIWITRANSVNSLLQINPTTGAQINEFPMPPGPGAAPQPKQMTIGPDDNIWFGYAAGPATPSEGGIARYVIGTNTYTLLPFTSNLNAKGITAAPDGNLWFISGNSGNVYRQTPAGTRTAFSQSPLDFGPSPHEITFGPDGYLWAGGIDRIGRIEVDGVDPACLPPAFSDVPTNHTFFDDICWMDQEGISTGFPNGTYRPNGNVTRSAMSAFMYRLAGEPTFTPPVTPTFNDVPTNHTFFLEIEWMADEDITTGYAGGLYKPDDAVKRQSMSAFMYRLADEPTFTPPGTATFNDVATSHPFFLEIEWMADEDITTGYAGGFYKPNANVSRAAMSAFMHRLEPLLPA